MLCSIIYIVPNYTVYITLVGVFGFSTFLNNTLTSVDIYTANSSGVYTNIGFVFSVFVWNHVKSTTNSFKQSSSSKW